MGRKSKSPIPVPKKMSSPALQHQDPPGTTYRCTCCGKYYTTQRGNFRASYSKLFSGWGGYYPVCNTCLSTYMDWLVGDIYDGDEAQAMHRVAQLLDIPFDVNVYQKALANAGDTAYSLIASYYQRMGTSSAKKNGWTYINTVLDHQEQAVADAAAKEKWQEDFKQYAIEEAEEKYKSEIERLNQIIESYRSGEVEATDEELMGDGTNENNIELIHRWGSGFSREEYDYLETQYEDWLDCYACDTKIQEELFRNICLAQLNINKAQHAEGGDIAKATKAFNDLVLMANIAPKQQKDILSETDTFGTLIQRWEEEAPIPSPRSEWEDVDGIKRYVSTWFLGHLSKMFGKKNDWAQMYEDEIAPYTAHPPAYQEDDVFLEDGDEANDEYATL